MPQSAFAAACNNCDDSDGVYFLAAAAPYIAVGDLNLILPLFAAVLLAAYGAHRLAKFTALRRLAPDWDSWEQGRKFPMGFALGPPLALYLGLAAAYGA